MTRLQDEVVAAKKEAAELKAQLGQAHAALEEEQRERERRLSLAGKTQHRKSEQLAALENDKAKAELEQMKKDFAHQLQKKEKSYQADLAKVKRGIYNILVILDFCSAGCFVAWSNVYIFGYTEVAEEYEKWLCGFTTDGPLTSPRNSY